MKVRKLRYLRVNVCGMGVGSGVGTNGLMQRGKDSSHSNPQGTAYVGGS